ncbi:hypothetical protein JDV02_003832 [Purpureocillium takamizusanense]|uniref:C3H1-type domain-containing protein n=1 Tax=Purpureocillium takamizusanense TaxID=2060973 RepID=A0A9Q8VA63_9HYPO|nr:uncharacterized protein JDV02_003832 [Purpureocillium takamizusanense]UNI17492.1 hypothetical protein JDV02_003832 [Purpureocillium takamizusanense]
MVVFAFHPHLRSRFSTSTSPPPPRALDRPLPPFLLRFRRRDRSTTIGRPIVASAAAPTSFFSRHDVTAAAALIQTPSVAARTRTFAAPVLGRRPLPPLPVMALCRFYQQGNCKYSNNCRFEHPKPQNQNRFGALGGGAAGGTQNAPAKYSVSSDTIEKDLTLEKPQWILSAYGPGRDAPDQLFGGYPREQSFEELRLHYLAGKASGNEQQALNEAQQLYQNAQQQIDTALRDVEGAARFIVERESQHPNRHDVCREGTQGAPFGEFEVAKRARQTGAAPAQANPFSTGAGNAPSAFGAPSQPAAGAFGQPSALGQKPNPFGTPAFGQPAQPASAFGQPSQPAAAFGQPSQPSSSSSPFGQAAQGGGPPPFGQAAQPASAFGQPTTLGAKPNPFGTPAFGQPAQPSTQGSAFGQAGQLGQKPNPFGSNANTNAAPAASPFANMGAGAGDNAATTSPFGAQGSGPANAAPNPFSSAAPTQNTTSPFAQAGGQAGASPFGQAATPAANPFGGTHQQQQQQQQPPAANNPFGQPSQPQMNGTLGQAASNPFGQNAPQNTQAAPNPFGQQQPAASRPNPFGAAPQQEQRPAAAAASAGNPYPPGSTRQHPPIESYTARGMDGSLSAFKGKPVSYKGGEPGLRAFDGTWTRIWFPNGPPGYYKDTELPPEAYDQTARAQWEAFVRNGGAFEGGVMPELPPPRECTQWDF